VAWGKIYPRSPCGCRRREWTKDAKHPWTGRKTGFRVGGPSGKPAAGNCVRPAPLPVRVPGTGFYVLGNDYLTPTNTTCAGD